MRTVFRSIGLGDSTGSGSYAGQFATRGVNEIKNSSKVYIISDMLLRLDVGALIIIIMFY